MIESIEQGRKEDGNRSIADKIKSRLHDLEQTVESNLGRWAWELLQNAKDSISEDTDRDVCVQIELNNTNVTFKHNGSYFTELDIRGLINQISSKEVEEGEQTRNTGRFGTGFLTTHMLSRKVNVAGIVRAEGSKYYSFDFLLDREGKTTIELAPKVESAWTGFQKSTVQLDSAYDENAFNTSFSYLLETDEQKEIANKGVVEFSKLIPYVLTFIPKISEVKIIDNVLDKEVLFRNSREVVDHVLTRITKTENSNITDILILCASNDKVSIAIEVEETSSGFSVMDITEFPKLFCDFPLIGSEKFHFPMIVNSFFFNPLTERDGVWLKSETSDEVLENRVLLESAVELYIELVSQLEQKEYSDLYNLAITKVPSTDEKHFDRGWYVESIQKKLRDFLITAKIVQTNNGRKSIKDVYFPGAEFSKDDREKIWGFSSDLRVNDLPIKEHVHKWSSVAWSDCSRVDIDDLVQDLKSKENIENLKETLGVEEEQVFEWLNDCFEFIYSQVAVNFGSYEIIPNQGGNFKVGNLLSLDEIEDHVLKRVAKLVGYDYFKELVHKNIFLPHHTKKISIQDVATKITSLINEDKQSEERNLAISNLIEWFESNSEKGKEYFPDLYRKKEKLLVDTIKDKESLFSILNCDIGISEIAGLVSQVRDNPSLIKESIDKANQIDIFLQEFGAASLEELRQLLLSANVESPITLSEPASQKIEITKETLASLGVTTFRELEEALKDEKISQQFHHTTTPTVEMFQYAQEKIERAKVNILEHLESLPDYDCVDAEDLAPTVIGGITKFERLITVVVRPSDNKQVIIYYDSEKDSLDYDVAELWIDDGETTPRSLTLGKVLKSTGITKIPV